MPRQQAQANNLNFRSLALPRSNSSIGIGSVQAIHSASDMDCSSLIHRCRYLVSLSFIRKFDEKATYLTSLLKCHFNGIVAAGHCLEVN